MWPATSGALERLTSGLAFETTIELMKSILSGTILIIGSMTSAACADCAGIGLTEIRPGPERTISVGASFVLEYWTGGSCGTDASRHLDRNNDVRWWTPDTLVIRVDSASGLVRGLRIGDALVWVGRPGERVGPTNNIGEVLVHVR